MTLEIESWLDDRRSHLKSLHKFWTEKIKADIAQKDLQLAELTQAREGEEIIF